jgi:hypothetical protein
MNEYLYINRPPGIGCQPPGGNVSATWYPMQDQDTPIGRRSFFGKVKYDEPLPLKEIDRYELLPVDRLEWAKLQIWQCVKWDEYFSETLESYRKVQDRQTLLDLSHLQSDEPIIFAILTIFAEYEENVVTFTRSLSELI